MSAGGGVALAPKQLRGPGALKLLMLLSGLAGMLPLGGCAWWDAPPM